MGAHSKSPRLIKAVLFALIAMSLCVAAVAIGCSAIFPTDNKSVPASDATARHSSQPSYDLSFEPASPMATTTEYVEETPESVSKTSTQRVTARATVTDVRASAATTATVSTTVRPSVSVTPTVTNTVDRCLVDTGVWRDDKPVYRVIVCPDDLQTRSSE